MTSTEPLRLALAAMGTRFELVLPEAPAAPAARTRLHALGEEALREVILVEARWSLFRRDAFLAHLMATAAEMPVRLDDDDRELLLTAKRVHALSGGAFDPCVAPLVARRGFARPASVRTASRATFDDVEVDTRARTVRFRRGGIALDLGGIAKGHALDRAGRVLVEGGVRAALLHGGTSAVLALGAPPDGHAWRVRLGRGAGAPAVDMVDSALAVSAHDGQRAPDGASHVVDPRDLVARPSPPVGPERVAAAAIALALHADVAPLAFADALATAALVLGAPVAARALPDVTQALEPRGAAWCHVAGPPRFVTSGEPYSSTPTR